MLAGETFAVELGALGDCFGDQACANWRQEYTAQAAAMEQFGGMHAIGLVAVTAVTLVSLLKGQRATLVAAAVAAAFLLVGPPLATAYPLAALVVLLLVRWGWEWEPTKSS